VSKSPIKSTLISYGYGSGYGYETIGKPQQGELLSYFDISSAEVKIFYKLPSIVVTL